MTTSNEQTPRSRPGLTVIDLGLGNIGSVLKLLNRSGAEPRLATSADDLTGERPVVLPGVGHFTHAVAALDRLGLRDRLDALYRADCPVLGICLGAQLLCSASEEGEGAGLGWCATEVRRFPATATDGTPLRVPHMAWRTFSPPAGTLPFDIGPGRMYFAHSYYIDPAPLSEGLLCTATFGGIEFASVVRSRNALGVQFHPEKSHRFGESLIRGWIAWSTARCEEARR